MLYWFRIHILFALALSAVAVCAQSSSSVPQRTAEERAMKQTEMLVRDLGIRDSLMRDSIYRVHLRYARAREAVSTRAEVVDCLNRLLAELKNILSAEDYERLQAIPLQQSSRASTDEQRTGEAHPTPPTP